jgi:hypothetical protein
MDFNLHTNYYVGFALLVMLLALFVTIDVGIVFFFVASLRLIWQDLVRRTGWYRPSRRACRQVTVARRKHAVLLAAYKKLQAEQGKDYPASLIRWDYPTLEAFIGGNYWHDPAQAIGDIRLFLHRSQVNAPGVALTWPPES